jgi:hypothetical protein
VLRAWGASVGSLVRGDRTSDLREIFRFAHPEQIIKAGQVYASDVYGFML